MFFTLSSRRWRYHFNTLFTKDKFCRKLVWLYYLVWNNVTNKLSNRGGDLISETLLSRYKEHERNVVVKDDLLSTFLYTSCTLWSFIYGGSSPLLHLVISVCFSNIDPRTKILCRSPFWFSRDFLETSQEEGSFDDGSRKRIPRPPFVS